MTIALLIMLILSVSANVYQRHELVNRPDRPVYKEIEVIKKAMCECEHPSSVHNERGRCRQEMFMLDGIQTSKSYQCFCAKYTGPTPLSEYFDDQARELETKRFKD